MNPNDILAQQQALQDQLLKTAQHDYWLIAWPYLLIISVLLIILGVIGLFCYARLGAIAEEMRMLRVAYEMAEDAKAKSAKPMPPRADDDSRYAPKS